MVDKEILDDIKGFGFGILYQIFLCIFQLIICVLFVINLILNIKILNTISFVCCFVSLIITTIDLILSFKYCVKKKEWALILLDVWFFIKYSWLPSIILILMIIF